MQKKHFLLVVLILGALSAVFFVSSRNSHFRLGGMMADNDLIQLDSMMETDDYIGRGESAGSAGMPLDIAVSKQAMIAEPMIGIMPPYYGDDVLEEEDRYYENSSYHSVVVKDVSKYVRGIKEYFSSVDGVVLSSSMSSGEKYDTASLYVKVPVEKFDEATGRVTDEVKKVMDESVNVQDVTGRVVNTKDNVVSLQEQKTLKEAQLKDSKTEVEKARLKIDIERLDRQIELAQKTADKVEGRTNYASISLTAASDEKYFNPGSRGDFSYELDSAWESLKSFVRVGAVFGIWIVVYSLVWAPVVWIVGKIINKFKK